MLLFISRRHHCKTYHSNNGYPFLLSCHLVWFILLSLPRPHGACSQLERGSLLSFLSNISTTRNNSLLSLWGSEFDCCLWEGISCDASRSVTHLWLPLKGLRGRISPSLANLTYLSHLNLSHNWLSDTLPSDLLLSPHLVVLDVSFNHLSGQLSVPATSLPKSNSRPLEILNISSNYFKGVFPLLGGLYPNLRAVNTSNNSFSGPIPASICLGSPLLSVLDFSRNQFGGDTAMGLDRCSRLMVFRAGFNNLSGQLLDDFFGATSLEQLSLPFNQLSGTLDGERIANLTNLIELDLSANGFTGKLPAAIGRLGKLQLLFIYSNQLGGILPPDLSNCSELRYLNLRGNNLSGELSTINFSSFVHLTVLDLGNNNFIGDIPDTIYLCRSLTALRLANNNLRGQIMPGMTNLQALSYLSLSYNRLVNISSAFQILKSCKGLVAIILTRNFIGEAIPDNAHANWGSAFQSLKALILAECQLSGEVPSWLAELGYLEVLDLSSNQLSGSVPSWLGSLPHLFYVDLSSNLLLGELPLEITQLLALTSEQAASQLDKSYMELPVFAKPTTNASILQYNQLRDLPPALCLRNNNLSGMIPQEVGLLKMLQVLDLSHNNFSGEIPIQLSNLTNLEKLDLSGNHLSGMIPPLLNRLNFLASFNVANNDLEGPIPSGGQFETFPNSSFEGNPKLCGLMIMQPCTNQSGTSGIAGRRGNKKLLFSIALSIFSGGAFTFTLLAIYVCSRKGSKHPGGGSISNTEMNDLDMDPCNPIAELPCDPITDCSLVMLFPFHNETKDLTVSDIFKATDNFSQTNIVGTGGFGVVYKAILANGTKLAIKRLSGDMCVIEREFKAEVEALSMAQHENLVPLQGYCMQGNFRLLIYSYMENGSLDYWLHERADGGAMLDWPIRLKIAWGASRGLSYIHQVCQPHIVHRDIKSSNILLDENFEAYVADFGLSRLILPYNTHVTTELVGTLGYIPPEYGQAWVATLKGDVYSFGVVILELLTGRRPSDIFRPKPSRELVGWVQQTRNQGKQEELFDPLLRGKGHEEQMVQVLNVACMCVNHNPSKRPTIKEVVNLLENLGAISSQSFCWSSTARSRHKIGGWVNLMPGKERGVR